MRLVLMLLLVAMLALAGCGDREPVADARPIEAVEVLAGYHEGAQVLSINVVGGTKDDGARSGIGMAWPFNGRLTATYYAGHLDRMQEAAVVDSGIYPIRSTDFQDDSETAAFMNDLYRQDGGEPEYGSDNIWSVTLADDDVEVQCGGFYVLQYEVRPNGSGAFRGNVEFRVDPC